MVERMKIYLQFLSDVRQEFSRVIWPSKQELMGTTLIVLILVVFFALYIGAVDYTFNFLARRIL